jgi:Kef-type K+ transport system membrane component KefB
MNLLSQRGENAYGVCTAITFVVSLLPLFITTFGVLWVGFNYWRADLLAVGSALSSAGLCAGMIRYRSRSRSVAAFTLLGATFLPAIVISLLFFILVTPGSDKARLGSLGWWSVIVIDAVQIYLSSLKLLQIRATR